MLARRGTSRAARRAAPPDQEAVRDHRRIRAHRAADIESDADTADASSESALDDLPHLRRPRRPGPRSSQALAGVGITHPFPIQAMTLPVALAGHDIIGQAKTGTGKTLGFGIPLLQRVVAPGEDGFDALEAPGKPQALVVVPTRELAVQVAGDLATAGKLRARPRAHRLRRPRLRAAGRGPDARASRSSSARPAGCSTSPSRST